MTAALWVAFLTLVLVILDSITSVFDNFNKKTKAVFVIILSILIFIATSYDSCENEKAVVKAAETARRTAEGVYNNGISLDSTLNNMILVKNQMDSLVVRVETSKIELEAANKKTEKLIELRKSANQLEIQGFIERAPRLSIPSGESEYTKIGSDSMAYKVKIHNRGNRFAYEIEVRNTLLVLDSQNEIKWIYNTNRPKSSESIAPTAILNSEFYQKWKPSLGEVENYSLILITQVSFFDELLKATNKKLTASMKRAGTNQILSLDLEREKIVTKFLKSSKSLFQLKELN